MFPVHKNSYLQLETKIDPRIINRCVDRARENPSIDQYDTLHPSQRITAGQPCIPVHHVDVTRRPLAFGKRALPKLKKELHSKNPCLVKQAIASITDLVHDPEKNFEAIKLKIPDRMVDLLIHKNPSIRERTLIALALMADLWEGKCSIVKNTKTLQNLEKCLQDENSTIRLQTVALLERVSLLWMAADYLVEGGFINILITKFGETFQSESRKTALLVLKTLQNLMYCSGKFVALECGLFDLCINIINNTDDEEIIGASLKCLSLLMETPEGKEMAYKKKIIKLLYKLLFDNVCNALKFNTKISEKLMFQREVVYENVLAAMLFATIKLEVLVKVYKLKDLIPRLLQLSKNHLQTSTQRQAIQILSNLTGHGKMKKFILYEKFEEIKAIHIEDPGAKRARDILLVDALQFC